ncbi:Tubulin_tyrosine ligase [Hexamita inflata]|uniref:Tubulin--tyrosine ligase-like protein 5 n=1 Tax=Hexamita inflata TaxID=28002 RepID=A0AA86PGE2_9EUKA|nr:Tubulin tyrosine ligase [Hexamita inflata]
MEPSEVTRRCELNKDYIGQSLQLNDVFSFTNVGEPVENPKVLFKGPTTKVVRRTFADAGFIVSESNSFNICWGSPQPLDFMDKLQPGQLIAHICGQYCMVRKDNLSDLIEDAARRNPVFKQIAPKQFSLPAGLASFKLFAKLNKGFYALKSANAARGEGVKIVAWNDEFKVKDAVIQQYIPNPLLIDGKKFDLRVYVCVTSVDPLIAYVFKEGLGRFATKQYENPTDQNKTLKTVHLTNYSVNKQENEMDVNEYKWKLTDVLNWIQKEYKGQAKLMYGKTEKASARGEGEIKIPKLPKLSETKVQNESTEDIITKPEEIALKNLHHVICATLIAAEPQLSSVSAQHGFNSLPRKQFGFYGFDLMFLEDLTVQLVEVNVNPSTATESRIDQDVKFWMLRDLFQLVGVKYHNNKGQTVIPSLKTNEERPKSGTVNVQEFKLLPGERRLGNGKELSRYEELIKQEILAEKGRIGSFTRILPDKSYANLFANVKRLNQLCWDMQW